MRLAPLLLVCALVGACSAEPSGGQPTDRDRTDDAGGGDGDPTDDEPQDEDGATDEDAGAPMFSRCIQNTECAAGLACIELGASSYCVKQCFSQGACDDGTRCVGDVCLQEVAHYAVCDAVSTCTSDAFCHANAAAPTRCTPVCDAGVLTDYDAVESCPGLPEELTGTTPTCTADLLDGIDASFCSAHAKVGALCDEFALLCEAGDRPDTDTDHEAASEGAPDPGALRCLDDGEAMRCLRVCSTDGGVTESACGCAGDSACDEPTSWTCEAITGLAENLRVCVAR